MKKDQQNFSEPHSMQILYLNVIFRNYKNLKKNVWMKMHLVISISLNLIFFVIFMKALCITNLKSRSSLPKPNVFLKCWSKTNFQLQQESTKLVCIKLKKTHLEQSHSSYMKFISWTRRWLSQNLHFLSWALNGNRETGGTWLFRKSPVSAGYSASAAIAGLLWTLSTEVVKSCTIL